MQKKGPVIRDPMVSLTNRALVSFIAEENFAGLQHLLDSRKVVVDDRDENGMTALMVAAQRGKLIFVRSLLEHGADVNAEDADCWTALLFASKEGHDDVVVHLLDHGATADHRDVGGWTALMWASYKGRTMVAHALIEKGADVNVYGNYNVSCLGWAAGRNHVGVVKELIEHGAKVNSGDKYGTTPLIWAARRGNLEIVDILLSCDANVDACGMTSWTALLVATAGDHVEVVKLLLEHKPNVNALDKDGCSALTISCKEGFHEIAIALINAGAYINVNDRGGSSNLVHAAKGGYRSIVDALIKKHADVNVQGKDRKTALYWAVEKNHVGVVKSILAANPDLELSTKDGDTPLMKSTRNRNMEIVSLLLEKKARVTATDKGGDTCLHIAMRARSKQIVELLLRNPVNSQLLYRPNRAGETPYNIDRNSPKPLLTQLFGSRGLNTQEDFENLLGYNLYSSALADMLSDPTLSMPITVGLFARWGSGKSFLLGKLKDEMALFARQWLNPLFTWSPLLFILIVCLSAVLGVIAGLSFWSWEVGVSFSFGLTLLIHASIFTIWFCSQRSKSDWPWPQKVINYLATQTESARLIFQVIFCHPAGTLSDESLQAQPINFYFTEQAKISCTAGGEKSLTEMLVSLYSCLESDYGTFPTRLFRAFRPKPVSAHAPWKWRKLCCIPYCIIFLLCFICSLVSIVVLSLYVTDKHGLDATTLQILMYSCALFVALLLVANLYTIGQVLKAVVNSHKRHLHKTVNKMYAIKTEGILHALRAEVTLLTEMVRCLDCFTGRQSRMVVIVDGLDSGEQDKVLQVLDAVNILFNDNKAPFIILLAIDPHITSKGIEMNINPVLNDANIGGQDYLRNLVHLPFYLQNAALRKVKQVKMLESTMNRKTEEENQNTVCGRKSSVESNFGVSLALERFEHGSGKKPKRLALKGTDSAASSIAHNINKVGVGPGDLKKMLLGDDYFSDVNPRSMRRLMNIIHVTGRLLKAFNFEFNWHNLSTWVNVTEQWPYRLSWMIIYCEILQRELNDSTSLKVVYERVKPFIPTTKEVDLNIGLDRDEKKLDSYLAMHKGTLLVSTLYIFLPFTISLDPQLRKDITEKYQPSEQMFKLPPGGYKPTIQPPASPFLNPAFGNNLRFRQNGRGQPTIGQAGGVQPFCQHGVTPSTPVNSLFTNIWPFQGSGYPTPSGSLPTASESLIAEIKSVRLGTLSVDGVCNLLSSLPNLNDASVGNYQDAIRKNNISGCVLLCCDLNELKGVLNMTFGDWEIFKSAITALRDAAVGLSSSDFQEDSAVTINVRTETNGNSAPLNFAEPNAPEKQITMEDQMITGALELLNDEARDDVRRRDDSTKVTHNPPDMDADGAFAQKHSKSFPERNETDVLYMLGTSTNVTAELPDSPRVLRTLQNQKSHFSVLNESLPKTVSVPANMLANFDPTTTPRVHYHSARNPSAGGAHHSYKTPTPQHSPGKKRSSFKRVPLSRSQLSAVNLPAAVSAHLRRQDEEGKYARSPEKSPKKFRIGGNTSTEVSSDESQKPLVNRALASMQARKSVVSRTSRIEETVPQSPKKRVSKDETPTSSRLARIKSSIFGYVRDGTYPSTQGASGIRGRQESYMTTEESSEPVMYFHNEPRGKPWTQYRAPTPLPPFGSEEYYRVIKSSNPSPTTTNESELGSSLEELSSGENLFFPEPPELPESPFPRRFGLSFAANPGVTAANFTGFPPSPFVQYLHMANARTEKRHTERVAVEAVPPPPDNIRSGTPTKPAAAGVTVLKLGSAETLLQEASEAPPNSDEESPPISKCLQEPGFEMCEPAAPPVRRMGNLSTRDFSFPGRGVVSSGEEKRGRMVPNFPTNRLHFNLSDPVLSSRNDLTERIEMKSKDSYRQEEDDGSREEQVDSTEANLQSTSIVHEDEVAPSSYMESSLQPIDSQIQVDSQIQPFGDDAYSPRYELPGGRNTGRRSQRTSKNSDGFSRDSFPKRK